MRRPSFRIALLGLVALALIVRVVGAERYSDITPQTDALDYDRHAVSIAGGNGYPEAARRSGGPGPTAFRPPLYPVVLSGAYVLSGTEDEAKRWMFGHIQQAFIGALVVALIALIARRLWNDAVALVAAGLAALYPPLILAGSALQAEALFIALTLGAVASVLKFRETEQHRWLVAASALAALATLTRTNGIVVIAMAVLGVWVLKPRFSIRALRGPVLVIAVAALVIMPWTIRNAVELDAFVPVSTQTGFALAGQFNNTAAENDARWLPPFAVPEYEALFNGPDPIRGEVALGEELSSRAKEYAMDHPGHIVEAGFWNTLRLFNLDDPIAVEQKAAFDLGQPQELAKLSVYAFWVLAVFSIAALFFASARRMPLFMVLIPVLFFVTVMFVSGLTRYRTPADPFLILVVSAAVVEVFRARSAQSRSEA